MYFMFLLLGGLLVFSCMGGTQAGKNSGEMLQIADLTVSIYSCSSDVDANSAMHLV